MTGQEEWGLGMKVEDRDSLSVDSEIALQYRRLARYLCECPFPNSLDRTGR